MVYGARQFFLDMSQYNHCTSMTVNQHCIIYLVLAKINHIDNDVQCPLYVIWAKFELDQTRSFSFMEEKWTRY